MTTAKERASLKYRLLMRLTNYIYRHVGDRRQVVLEDLVRRNNTLTFEAAESFYYQGRRWPSYVHHVKTIELHEQLLAEADEFFAWYLPIEQTEVPLVQAFIRRILNHSDDVAVLFSLLPGSLHDAVRDILNAADLEIQAKPLEEVAKIVGASEKSVRAFSIRMMSDLVGA